MCQKGVVKTEKLKDITGNEDKVIFRNKRFGNYMKW